MGRAAERALALVFDDLAVVIQRHHGVVGWQHSPASLNQFSHEEIVQGALKFTGAIGWRNVQGGLRRCSRSLKTGRSLIDHIVRQQVPVSCRANFFLAGDREMFDERRGCCCATRQGSDRTAQGRWFEQSVYQGSVLIIRRNCTWANATAHLGNKVPPYQPGFRSAADFGADASGCR